MTFIDSNVLIDVFGSDPRREDWSKARIEEQSADHDLVIDPVVVAELSPGYRALDALLDLLASVSIAIVPIEEEIAFVAGHRFAAYRRDREVGLDVKVLPDFFIAAHASVLQVPVLTRDPRFFRRYFPELTLITPETHPDE